MMTRRAAPLLLALLALLGLLRQAAALAGPPGNGTAPPRAASPAPAEAGALAATLDELTARVKLLSRGAEATTAEATALRRELGAAEARIRELEAARAEAEAALARLRAELVRSQAEARALREAHEARPASTDNGSNAVLATMTTGPAAAAGGAGEDDRRSAAGADSSAAPPAAPEIRPSPAHQALLATEQTKDGQVHAAPEQPAPARPERLPAVPQSSDARPSMGAATQINQPAITGRGADAKVRALRAALVATKRRIEETKGTDTPYKATTAELPTASGRARMEAPPGERPSAAPATAAAGGHDPTENPVSPAPPGEMARDTPAAEGSHGAGTGDAEHLAASTPVNLRAAPTMSAEVLVVVEEGSVVRRIGRDGGWLRVAYTDRFATAYTGWIYSSFLRSVGPPSRGDGPPARTEG